MTQPKSDLAYLRSEKAKAEQQLRYYKHREKILEHQIPELTRKARVHRLCTRAGMLESFLIAPEELTNDQVMELLKIAFRQPEVALALAKMIHDLQERRSVSIPLESRAQLYTVPVKLRSCRRLDEIEAGVCSPARFHPKENCIFLALPCSYPFADPALPRSAQHSASRRRAKPNTIPDRSPRAILLGGLFVWG